MKEFNHPVFYTYTFVLEFKGGTYLSQVREISPINAKISWSRKVYDEGIIDLSGCTPHEFTQMMKDDEMVSVIELTNVWCSTFLIEDDFGLIHIIETSEGITES